MSASQPPPPASFTRSSSGIAPAPQYDSGSVRRSNAPIISLGPSSSSSSLSSAGSPAPSSSKTVSSAKYPASSAVSTASFKLVVRSTGEPTTSSASSSAQRTFTPSTSTSSHGGHGSRPSSAQRSIDVDDRQPVSRSSAYTHSIQRHPSASSIASSTDSPTPSSLSNSNASATSAPAVRLFSPTKAHTGSSSQAARAASGSERISRPPALTSPVSATSTSSRQSGYEGSPDSANGDDGSPRWGHHLSRTPQHRSSESERVSAVSSSSSSSAAAASAAQPKKHTFRPKSSSGVTSASRSRIMTASPTTNPPSALDTAATPTSAHALASPPPLQRSTSPDRIGGIFSPSGLGISGKRAAQLAQQHAVQQARSPLVIPAPKESPAHRASRLDETHGGAELMKVSQMIQAEKRRHAHASSSSPDRSHHHAASSPPAITLIKPSSSRPGPIRVDSSLESPVTPKTHLRPSTRSPAGLTPDRITPGGSGGATPNFAKGNFLGSPLAFDDGGEDLDESGDVIEILETIPLAYSDSGPNIYGASAATLEREEEERDSVAAFKPKLKLQLSRDDDLTSSADRDAFIANASPKNTNVFGLKLFGVSDSTASSVAPSVANSAALTRTASGGSNSSLSASQSTSSLNDSLTSSGRIALANFHASHAAALASNKRAPTRTSSNGSNGARGKHRVTESYDVSQFGTLILDGFEIGSTGVQRTPHVEHYEDDDLDSTRRSFSGTSLYDLSDKEGVSPLPLAAGGRRPSAVAQKLLIPSTPGPGPGTPSEAGKIASLGVEFRLSDMVRIGDLGVGQNGTVVKALYLPTLRIVALKVCTVFEKDERHQMLKELRAFNSCNSSHIISFVGACFMEGRITMALEFMNRGSLDQVVKKQGPLSVSMIRNISRQVLKGLKHMHQRKCIHRDIKPANVLIDYRPDHCLLHGTLVRMADGTSKPCQLVTKGDALLGVNGQTVLAGDVRTTIPVRDVWCVKHDDDVEYTISSNHRLTVRCNRSPSFSIKLVGGDQWRLDMQYVSTDVRVVTISTVIDLLDTEVPLVDIIDQPLFTADEEVMLLQRTSDASIVSLLSAKSTVVDRVRAIAKMEFDRIPRSYLLRGELAELTPVELQDRTAELALFTDRPFVSGIQVPMPTAADNNSTLQWKSPAVTTGVASSEEILKSSAHLMVGSGASEPFVEGASARIVYQFHNPLDASVPFDANAAASKSFTLRQVEEAHARLGRPVTHQDGIVMTEMNPTLSKTDALDTDLYKASIDHALSFNTETIVVFGAYAREQWLRTVKGGVQSGAFKDLSDALVSGIRRLEFSRLIDHPNDASPTAESSKAWSTTTVWFSAHPCAWSQQRVVTQAVALAHGVTVPADIEEIGRAPFKSLIHLVRASVADPDFLVTDIPIVASAEVDRRFVLSSGVVTHNSSSSPLAVKISDFGLLKQLDATNQMASTFVGTMMYLPVESLVHDIYWVHRANCPVSPGGVSLTDPNAASHSSDDSATSKPSGPCCGPTRVKGGTCFASDIWSWGISLIYLATGGLSLPKDYWALLNAVQKPSPGLDRDKFPKDMCDFVDACLIKDASARPSAATLLNHPFILSSDPPGTPVQHWPFSASKDPDARELDLLVQAVIDHYYFTPTEVAVGLHLLPAPSASASASASSRAPKTIFSMNQTDELRIQQLAQQMAWRVQPLKEAFIKRLVVRGSSLGGVPGEATIATDDAPTLSPSLRNSRNSFSSGSSGSSGGASVSSSQHRIKLERQRSVTLDHDPLFGEILSLSASRASSLHNSLDRSRASLHNSFDRSRVSSVSSLHNSLDRSRTASLQNSLERQEHSVSRSPLHSYSGGSVRRNSGVVVTHTSSPMRRLDDSSEDSTAEWSEDEPYGGSHARRAAAAAARHRPSYSSANAFDSHAKIRSLTNANGAVAALPLYSKSSTSSSSSSQQPQQQPNVRLSLGAQLEDLMEDSD